jgi:endonuclease/exonuclease/phosphatase family metal-dependent hydrolase
LRLATYNIRHGAPAGRLAANRAMARSVASLRADVVALQEVDRHVVRSWFADQAGRAGRRSATVPHFAAARSMGPGGSYGNALLVRGRTERTRTVELPGPGERRVALFARVVVADVELTVVCTHLQNRAAGRPSTAPEQLASLLDELSGWPEPWCVMGDLNLRADVVLPMLAAAGLAAVGSGPTFPAPAPRIGIDWIATRGLGAGSAHVPDLRTSDHRPVVATFDAPGPGGFPHSGHPAADPSPEPDA